MTSASSTFYLEQYLDSLENLPSELKKNFNKMQDRVAKEVFEDFDAFQTALLLKETFLKLNLNGFNWPEQYPQAKDS